MLGAKMLVAKMSTPKVPRTITRYAWFHFLIPFLLKRDFVRDKHEKESQDLWTRQVLQVMSSVLECLINRWYKGTWTDRQSSETGLRVTCSDSSAPPIPQMLKQGLLGLWPLQWVVNMRKTVTCHMQNLSSNENTGLQWNRVRALTFLILWVISMWRWQCATSYQMSYKTSDMGWENSSSSLQYNSLYSSLKHNPPRCLGDHKV